MADNQEILACPFCGGECATMGCGYDTDTYVWCEADGCGYESKIFDTPAEAIAAHNKVSRANAISDSYAALFDEVEAFFEGCTDTYIRDDDRGIWKAYNAVLDAEEGT